MNLFFLVTHTHTSIHKFSHVPSYISATSLKKKSGCSEGELRMVDGNATEGRIEICLNNEWGTICDQMWDNVDAGVVCRQLHLNSQGINYIMIALKVLL